MGLNTKNRTILKIRDKKITGVIQKSSGVIGKTEQCFNNYSKVIVVLLATDASNS